MAKKRKGLDHFGEDGDSLFDDVLDDSDLPEQSYTYDTLDLTNTKNNLEEKAKKLVKGIADVYFQAEELDETTYRKTIQDIESMNLKSLLLQIKYGEHMLSTLMSRLEHGEHGDNSLYRLIMDLQNNQLNITMTISQYIRNLPAFFKHLFKEMSEAGAINSPIISIENSDMMKELPNGQMNIMLPQKGTRQLLMELEREMESMESDENYEDEDEIKINTDTE